MSTPLVVVAAALVSLFVAWAIGAGSSGATPFAPAVGADAIDLPRAVLIVGIASFLGAVLQGGAITETVGTGLIDGVSSSPLLGFVALATAGVLVGFGVYTGYPISTAFTVTGAVTGAGLAMGGSLVWPVYRRILLTWTLAPLAVGAAAYVTAHVLWSLDESHSLPALGAVTGGLLGNIQFGFLGPAGKAATLAGVVRLPEAVLIPGDVAVTLGLAAFGASVVHADAVRDPHRAEDRFLVSLGCLVAFSAGGSQVGLAIGPLLPLLGGGIPIWAVLVGGGIGLVAGAWTGAPRMIRALGHEYAELGSYRSIAALLPAFAFTQGAILFGIPISFTQAIVCAISGSGYVAGMDSVSEARLGWTAFGWVGSFALAFTVGFAVFTLVA